MNIGEPLSESELCPPSLLEAQEAAFQRDIERLLAGSDYFVEVPCPGCLSKKSHHAFEKFGFRFRTCIDCGTIYMSPRPSPQALQDYYADSENYRVWASSIFPASEATRREKICRPWNERLVEITENHGVRRGTLIEVGPGFGTFAELVTQVGSFDNVVVIEPTPEMAEACRIRGLTVLQQAVENVNPDSVPGADVLVAFEVIEHLFDPEVFLKSARRIIKDDGLLVLTCPNGEGFDISLLGPKALAVDAEHVNLFNPRAMSALLERTGFELVACQTPGRLDAEFVREAALNSHVKLDPFLTRVLIDEWERLGWAFQNFLASSGLSSHMWSVARKAS